MEHVKPLNKKAKSIEAAVPPSETNGGAATPDVYAMQQQPAPQPLGCALIFDPGWETDSSGGVTGLCQPVEADLYGCYGECWWPAQVPDQLVNHTDWTDKCAAAERDWKKLDLLFPEDK